MIVRTLGFLAALILLTGCGPADPEPPSSPPVVVPADLVGSWSTVTERANGFSYAFSSDGQYMYVGVMRSGSQQYTLQEGGTITVTGSRIEVTPQRARLARTDAGQPTTTTSPIRPPRTVRWSISGRTLTLTENGSPTRYERE